MSEISKALDVLMKSADKIVDEVADGQGTFTLEDFLYALMRGKQKEYIEVLYLCRNNKHPFNSAHSQIGKRLRQTLGDEYQDSVVDGTTVDVFHNPVANRVYQRSK